MKRDLSLCPECDRDLVYPVDWEEAGPVDWEVERHCPNCEWTDISVFDQAVVDQYDAQLDMHTETLVKALRGLVQANMAEETDRFAAALVSDQILPEDF